jgi:hypothetical protein
MHTAILVIGDDPQERALGLVVPDGTTDWSAIGGRYTGNLVPIPGAASARVFGDAIPAGEAQLLAAAPGMERGAGGPQQGAGVDQVERGELDIQATFSRFSPTRILDADGILHHPGLTPDESATLLALLIARRFGRQPKRMPGQAELDSIKAKTIAWQAKVTELIQAAAPHQMITVIDVHV